MIDKDSLPLDKPRRTPGHPTKSHVVKTRVDGKEKIIRFGEQGASTAGKPKEGESEAMKQKRASFKARHAKNIAKGKSSPAYWANKTKWATGGSVELEDLDEKYEGIKKPDFSLLESFRQLISDLQARAEDSGTQEFDPVRALGRSGAAGSLEDLYEAYSDKPAPHASRAETGAEPAADADMGGISPAADAALAALRASWSGPEFNIISGYRDPETNKRVGGAGGSQHLHGNAFDVNTAGWTPEEKLALADAAYAAGFRGFGFYNNNLHFDVATPRAWGPSYKRESVPLWAQDWVAQRFNEGGRVKRDPEMTEAELIEGMFKSEDGIDRLNDYMRKISRAGTVGKQAGRLTGIPFGGNIGRLIAEAIAEEQFSQEQGYAEGGLAELAHKYDKGGKKKDDDELARASMLADLDLMAQTKNPKAVPAEDPRLLNVGGLEERLALLNQTFNPVEAIGGAVYVRGPRSEYREVSVPMKKPRLSGSFEYSSGSPGDSRRKSASGSLTLSGGLGSITPGVSYSKDSSRQQYSDGVVVDEFGRRIGLSINGELFLDEGGENKLRAGASKDTMTGGYSETAGEELLGEDAYKQALERYFLGLDLGPLSLDVNKAGDDVSGRAAYRAGENMEFSVEDSNRGDPTFGFQFAKQFNDGGPVSAEELESEYMARQSRAQMDALYAEDMAARNGVPRPQVVQQEPSVLDIGGIGDRLALINKYLNPVEAIGESMDAGSRMMSPDVSGYDRVAALGDMLSGVAGVAGPAAVAKRVGAPAANAVMDALVGGSPTSEALSDMARKYATDESGALPGMGIGSLPDTSADVDLPNVKRPDQVLVRIPIEDVEHGESALPGGKLTFPGSRSLIEGYANRKTPLPPIDIMSLGDEGFGRAFIADGSHRYEAARLRGDRFIDAYVSRDDLVDLPTAQVIETTPAAVASPTAEALADMGRKYAVDETGSLPGMGIGLPEPRTEAEDIAREILQLRAEGRSDEVTDAMMNAADPQYMYYNTPLPMDAASREARMRASYRGDLYSGTGEDFPAFDNRAVYASTNPDLAYTYAPGDGGIIMPLAMRAKHGAPVVNAGGKNWNKLNPTMRVGGDNALPIPDDIVPRDIKSFNEFPMSTRDYEEAARRAGFSGVTFDDIVDVGGYFSKARPKIGTPEYEAHINYLHSATKPTTVEARFYPNQVRSRFARFDPEFAHLRNLSAGVAAGAIGASQYDPDAIETTASRVRENKFAAGGAVKYDPAAVDGIINKLREVNRG